MNKIAKTLLACTMTLIFPVAAVAPANAAGAKPTPSMSNEQRGYEHEGDPARVSNPQKAPKKATKKATKKKVAKKKAVSKKKAAKKTIKKTTKKRVVRKAPAKKHSTKRPSMSNEQRGYEREGDPRRVSNPR